MGRHTLKRVRRSVNMPKIDLASLRAMFSQLPNRVEIYDAIIARANMRGYTPNSYGVRVDFLDDVFFDHAAGQHCIDNLPLSSREIEISQEGDHEEVAV